METPIEKAVRIAGNQSALARVVDVSPQAVQQWVDAGRVSHKKVIAVEAATGVHRSELRPDLYPLEESATADPATVDNRTDREPPHVMPERRKVA